MAEVERASFRSKYANARISFPPEKFGLVGTDEMVFDNTGHVVLDNAGQPILKRKARKAVHLLGPDKPLVTGDPDLIACLRNHSGNEANGGYVFCEDTQQMLDAMAMVQGICVAHIPRGGVLDKDRDLLRKLESFSKHITPPAQDSALRTLADVLERFTIIGVTVPRREKGIRLLKAHIVMAMNALYDAGIASPDLPKRDADDDDDDKAVNE